MGMLTDKSQLNWPQQARFGLLGFAANGASNNATSALTTALATAGDGGTSVPLQVATNTDMGLITTGANNLCRIVQSSTKRPIGDANNNEVYGRLTQASNVYTLTYFTLVSGTQTPYTFAASTNIDFYPVYQFSAAQLPRDAGVAISAALIQDDPIVTPGGSTVNPPVQLNVTAANTVSALPTAPTAANRIILYVNGKAEFSTGGSPSFSVSGTAITWTPANAKYSLDPSLHEVYALVW